MLAILALGVLVAGCGKSGGSDGAASTQPTAGISTPAPVSQTTLTTVLPTSTTENITTTTVPAPAAPTDADSDLAAKFCAGWTEREKAFSDLDPEITQMELLREAFRTLDYPQELRPHAQRLDEGIGIFIDFDRTTPPQDQDAAMIDVWKRPEVQAAFQSAQVMREYAQHHC